MLNNSTKINDDAKMFVLWKNIWE